MMLGERHRHNPTVHVPPWSHLDNASPPSISSKSPPHLEILIPPSPLTPVTTPTSVTTPSYLQEALRALQSYLPSNDVGSELDPYEGVLGEDGEQHDSPVDAYSCDQFRIYEFKVRRCARGRSHDWTECPYAHPGEKARRRDPRKYHYSGTACPEFRKGSCKKGDSCEFAHGVFECWLHPTRYRTQPCKDGTDCRRRVCFFAHTPDQLRVLNSDSYDGSPVRVKTGAIPFLSSPSSGSSPPATPGDKSVSPPMSPMAAAQTLSRSVGSSSINEMVAALRSLQLGKLRGLSNLGSWNGPVGSGTGSGSGFGSPRGPMLRPGFCSLPATPTGAPARSGFGYLDLWDKCVEEEEEVPMERVQSGRELRARLFEKLSKENPLERVDSGSNGGPDVGWVSDLVQ